jgi:hypothetical protein
MGTQIYINPNACKPEFTKISAHSLSFEPSNEAGILYFGGSIEGFGDSSLTWSKDFFNYKTLFLGLSVNPQQQALGIPLPINLVKEDVVTISGTAVFNNYQTYTANGWIITLQVGVNYFNCNNKDSKADAFTFIPLESFVLTGPGVCFEKSVTLGSNYDAHETRFLVGFNVIITCPAEEECVDPVTPSPNLTTVSYTFDIQRPCAANNTSFIIKNCCEPIITELVNIPGLQVGSFHVDDEGNCWEVIEESQDVTNFTRNFVNNYTSCVECQNANPCPNNLVISSCCVQGQEFVTGSLPGLEVGDTFVDNHGLCWGVENETGGPISEESIVVDTIIPGGCEDCTLANPCPSFWAVKSCCTGVREIIATTVVLNLEDTFVDTNGLCWSVDESVQQLPTNYGIVVDTVYTGAIEPETNCDLCIAVNPCPTEYFLTIKSCADSNRIEVTQVPSQYMLFSEGTIFNDYWGVCWEVMSYDTTGVETYPIFDWNTYGGTSFYKDCENCISKTRIFGVYQVQECESGNIEVVLSLGGASIGSVSYDKISLKCFTVLGYGYPPFSELTVVAFSGEFVDCPTCLEFVP